MTERVIVRWLGLFVAVVLAFAGPMVARAAEPAEFGAIDEHVQGQMDASHVPGLALAIVQNGELAHFKGFGETADGRPVTAQTPFILGSTSKSFTSLAVMQLVEAGRIDLDAPVQRYLPVFRLADPEASAAITVRHLLNQTSGIPGTAGGEAYRSTRFVTPEEALGALSDERLAREPGTGWEYANANYVVLGLVIEAVSGQSYGDYLQEHVFTPLDMRHSYTHLTEAQSDGLAVGHRYWFGMPVAHEPIDVGALVPAGYITSTAEDLSHYVTMLLNGGTYRGQRVISEAGVAELQRPATEATLGSWADGTTSEYAMGWFVGGPWGEEPVVFHPGEAAEFTSLFAVAPDRSWGLVTLMNADMQLPLPGGEGTLLRIPSDVVSMMLGRDPARGGSLTRFYVVFDLIVLAIVAVQAWVIARLARRPFERHRRGLGIARIAVPLVWEFGLGAMLLLAPDLLGLSWPAVRLWMPDLALVLLVVGTLWLLTGVLRVIRLTRMVGVSRDRRVDAPVARRRAIG